MNITRVDETGVDIYANIVETREGKIHFSILNDHYSKQAGALIESGLLIDGGYTDVIDPLLDNDVGAPVTVEWCAERGQFRYYSNMEGWVYVDEAQLKMYQYNKSYFFKRIAQRISIASNRQSVEHISEVLWELGEARNLDVGGPVTIWFARRLKDSNNLQKVTDYLNELMPEYLGVLITTTPIGQDIKLDARGYKLIFIKDIDDYRYGLVIRPKLLASQMKSFVSNLDDSYTSQHVTESSTTRIKRVISFLFRGKGGIFTLITTFASIITIQQYFDVDFIVVFRNLYELIKVLEYIAPEIGPPCPIHTPCGSYPS